MTEGYQPSRLPKTSRIRLERLNATPQGAFDAGAQGIIEFVQNALDLFGL
ncbi:MAG TPA: hypothetical protein VJN71_07340 [Nitrososphaerales archaeon]|nr:hypothetical protein [Nitrososphaerales archaeon]